MTQTHCGEAEFVNHRIVRWAPGATQGSVAAGVHGPGSGPRRRIARGTRRGAPQKKASADHNASGLSRIALQRVLVVHTTVAEKLLTEVARRAHGNDTSAAEDVVFQLASFKDVAIRSRRSRPGHAPS